jgi:hypothetical protein
VQHHHRALVFLLQQLEPLHEGEAAGVAEQQQRGLGQALAGGADVALAHHADVALHVGAHVLGVANLLGLEHVVAALLAHGGLQRVDLRVHREQVEGPDELVQVAGNEGVDGLLARLVAVAQAVEVIGDHLLLQQHAALFDGFGSGVHACPHSLMESAKVPVCSLNTWYWLVFSA